MQGIICENSARDLSNLSTTSRLPHRMQTFTNSLRQFDFSFMTAFKRLATLNTGQEEKRKDVWGSDHRFQAAVGSTGTSGSDTRARRRHCANAGVRNMSKRLAPVAA